MEKETYTSNYIDWFCFGKYADDLYNYVNLFEDSLFLENYKLIRVITFFGNLFGTAIEDLVYVSKTMLDMFLNFLNKAEQGLDKLLKDLNELDGYLFKYCFYNFYELLKTLDKGKKDTEELSDSFLSYAWNKINERDKNVKTSISIPLSFSLEVI